MTPDDFLAKHLELTETKKSLNSDYEWYRKWDMVKRLIGVKYVLDFF